MGVLMLGVFLANGSGNPGQFQLPVWMMLLLSLIHIWY